MTGSRVTADPQTLLAQREWVRRVARALVADANAADDLEQDLWVGLLERPPRPRSSLRGWLAAALHHRFLNVKRADARRARHELAASRAEAVAPEQVVEEADAHRRVVDIVMELAEPYRTAVLLRFFQDLPPGEIARRLGVPTETVRTRLRRALALVRERLDAQTGSDRAAWCAALAPLVVRRSIDVAAANGAAPTGGVLVANKLVVTAAVAALVVAGGGVTWTVSRQAQDAARLHDAEAAARAAGLESAGLAAEVARLRAEIGARDPRDPAPRRGSAAPTAPTTLRSSIDDHATRIAALEESIAALAETAAGGAAASPARSPERRRKALQELLAIDDPEKRRTIRKLVDELVSFGDEVVPDVHAALDSGTERTFYENHFVAQSAGIVTGWPGQRTMLYDILREIETPAANQAFLESVGRAHRLADYSDVFALYPSTRNPVMIEGIAALVPDMLRCIVDAGGVAKVNRQSSLFSRYLAGFITYHKLIETSGAVEDLLTKAPAAQGGLPYEYEDFLAALLELAPERAAHVVLAAQQRDPEHHPVVNLSTWVQGGGFPRLIRYYETILAHGDLDARARRNLVSSMKVGIWQRNEGRRIEDGRAFAAFLERRASQETEPDVRAQFESKLAELRKAIDQAQTLQ